MAQIVLRLRLVLNANVLSIFFPFALGISLFSVIPMANGDSVDCLGGYCEVSHGNSTLGVNWATLPGIVDDGFGHRAKTPGGMTFWSDGGREVSFASGYFLRLSEWNSEKPAWEGFAEPDYAREITSSKQMKEISFAFSDVHSSNLDVKVDYKLIDYGQPPDAIPAQMNAVLEIITITNTGAEPVSFDWFIYRDWDVGPYGISDRSISMEGEGSTSMIVQHYNQSDRPRRTRVSSRPSLIQKDGSNMGSYFHGVALGTFGGRLDGTPTILNELLDDELTNFDPPPADIITDYSGNDFVHGVQFHFENVKNEVKISISHQIFRQRIFEPDFVLSANEDHSINVHFEWELPGRFYPPITVGQDFGVNYGSFAIADFTGDGSRDFVAATDQNPPQLYLFTRISQDEFLQTHLTQLTDQGAGVPGYGLGLITADLDNDGDMDFLENLRHSFSNGSWIAKGNAWLNDGTGVFSQVAGAFDFTSIYRGWTLGISSTLGDLNGDGVLDLLASAQSSGGDTSSPVYMLLGNGDGTFGAPQVVFQSSSVAATFITIGDFNNDGISDALVGGDDDGDPGASYLYAGRGDGTFNAKGEAIDTNPDDEHGFDKRGWGGLRAYDVNMDGAMDVVAGRSLYGPGSGVDTSSDLVWFKGLGNGSFDPGPSGAGTTIVAWPFETPLPHPTAFSSPITSVPSRDFNGDKCVDRADMFIVMNAVRSRLTDSLYDVNMDGKVNIADTRRVVFFFTNPRGAPCAQ